MHLFSLAQRFVFVNSFYLCTMHYQSASLRPYGQVVFILNTLFRMKVKYLFPQSQKVYSAVGPCVIHRLEMVSCVLLFKSSLNLKSLKFWNWRSFFPFKNFNYVIFIIVFNTVKDWSSCCQEVIIKPCNRRIMLGKISCNMVLEVGDTVVVFVGQLDVVVQVLRDFFLFKLLYFVSDESVEGFAVNSQPAEQLPDFLWKVLNCGKHQVVKLLFKDFIERIDKEEVEWRRGCCIIFTTNQDSLWSHFVRRVESNVLNFIFISPLITLDF